MNMDWQVKTIPERFGSLRNYLECFFFPLCEELRSDICSALEACCKAPSTEILLDKMISKVENGYNIEIVHSEVCGSDEKFEPIPGDLFLLSDYKKVDVSDLKRRYFNIGFIVSGGLFGNQPNKYHIESAEEIPVGKYKQQMNKKINSNSNQSLYAISLLNLIPYRRIGKAIHFKHYKYGKKQINGDDDNIVNKILSPDYSLEVESSGNPLICEKYFHPMSLSDLNESQLGAVLSVINKVAIHDCSSSPFSLIWGPPGTGKTKTTATLLFGLRNTGCQTIICAPTNIATLEIARRLVKLVKQHHGRTSDIVLMGNSDRMKPAIEETELKEVFLPHRVRRLSDCFANLTGWRYQLNQVKDILQDGLQMYKKYLVDEKKEKIYLSLIDFINSKYQTASQNCINCLKVLVRDLPSCTVSSTNMQNMDMLVDALRVFQKHLMDLFKSKSDSVDRSSRDKCIGIITTLLDEDIGLDLPKLNNSNLIERYCLKNATLIFCTASSSYKLYRLSNSKSKIIVIDEAANLKECEALIPLQLSRVKHAVLVGDERQLPALVKSKLSSDVMFGRSLFERLSCLGHKKHLLDIQYRMHPSISRFPNSMFYDNQILDGQNVKDGSYLKSYLPGKMYGSYSFIDVGDGQDIMESGGTSRKNIVEIDAVFSILGKLSNGTILLTSYIVLT